MIIPQNNAKNTFSSCLFSYLEQRKEMPLQGEYAFNIMIQKFEANIWF